MALSGDIDYVLTDADAPVFDDGMNCIVVADNLPTVPKAKVEKLSTILKKVFSEPGEVAELHLPRGDDDETLGFAFVRYANPEGATMAVEKLNGYKLDKKHIFAVTPMDKFDATIETPEVWTPPEEEPFDNEEHLQSFLLSPNCADQYVVRAAQRTTIYANKRGGDASVVYNKDKWTDTYCVWSPHGTYLATFHHKGIVLWGGKDFRRLARFNHPGVRLLHFSPNERYLVTWSSEVVDKDPKDPKSIIIWDIKTGAKMRGFPSVQNPVWPYFKWSHDDKYFAKLDKDAIRVYETPSMGLLNKKSIKIPSVSDFSWSPSDNYISYWLPEEDQKPARVVILAIPERRELATKNLFHVKQCKIHWQESGDFMCVNVERFTKSKKATYTNFELFHLREKLIPCDLLELKDTIMAFAWEPNGDKFAVIHGDPPGRYDVSFFQLKQAGGVVKLQTFERHGANSLYWSPRGRFCVVAGLYNPSAPNSMTGTLMFVDSNDNCSLVNHAEHLTATDVAWDPTGRYVMTSVSYWRHQSDNGYFVWTMMGRMLEKYLEERFYQLLWRPRPPTVLTKQIVQKEVKKKMKTFESQFQAEDKLSQSKASAEQIEKRRRMAEEFAAYRQSKKAEFDARLARMQEMRPDVPGSDGVEDKKETMVILVNEEVEVVDKL